MVWVLLGALVKVQLGARCGVVAAGSCFAMHDAASVVAGGACSEM